VLVECPVFVWAELLTHKRLARNASSSRAEGVQRHQAHGYYKPDVFYEVGVGMANGEPLPEQLQAATEAFWLSYHHDAYERVAAFNNWLKAQGVKGLDKQQINRLLPTTKMLRSVVTATEAAWDAFFALRCDAAADPAMQEMALKIAHEVYCATWVSSRDHLPFAPGGDTFIEAATLAAARIARTSHGAPGPGQRSDADLAADLLRMRHLSPFEHCAWWTQHPNTSALCSHESDRDGAYYEYCGWENHRSIIEHER
jgi:hypothetical protein